MIAGTPPKSLEGLVLQDRALHLLSNALERPSHAYLFVGPPDVGKTTAARGWAQALFCQARTGCGSCTECRAFLHGNHPDFHVWEPAGKHATTIEQVRQIVKQAELAPYRVAFQIHILRADTLGREAANCLLKTLEEPSPGTIVILTAKSLSDLLPTIVSRCQRIPFVLVPPAVIETWLTDRGTTPPRAAAAARRSGGRIGWALTLAEGDPPRSPLLLETRDLLKALEGAEKLAALPPQEQIQALEDLIDQVRDTIFLARTGRHDWIGQPEIASGLQQGGRSTQQWLRILEILEEARKRLQSAANAKLLWAVTAGKILEV